jgi:hypothetical protein
MRPGSRSRGDRSLPALLTRPARELPAGVTRRGVPRGDGRGLGLPVLCRAGLPRTETQVRFENATRATPGSFHPWGGSDPTGELLEYEAWYDGRGLGLPVLRRAGLPRAEAQVRKKNNSCLRSVGWATPGSFHPWGNRIPGRLVSDI